MELVFYLKKNRIFTVAYQGMDIDCGWSDRRVILRTLPYMEVKPNDVSNERQ